MTTETAQSLHAPQVPTTATLVAIAKNEGPYILEWLAFHLCVGFSRIVVYDNESTDDTADKLMRLALRSPFIDLVPWPSIGLHASPQTSAYNHSLKSVDTEWIMFLDIDEYLVPFGDGSLPAFLARVPIEASSVHVNWRGFGSSGLTSSDYGFVSTAFMRASHPGWSNNHHFKSIARARYTTVAHIHNIETSEGTRLLSDLLPFETYHNGVSNRIVHDSIQINHYQCKTYEEFRDRMDRGDANYHPEHGLKARDNSLVRFGHLDVNDVEDLAIAPFRDRHFRTYRDLLRLL